MVTHIQQWYVSANQTLDWPLSCLQDLSTSGLWCWHLHACSHWGPVESGPGSYRNRSQCYSFRFCFRINLYSMMSSVMELVVVIQCCTNQWKMWRSCRDIEMLLVRQCYCTKRHKQWRFCWDIICGVGDVVVQTDMDYEMRTMWWVIMMYYCLQHKKTWRN